MDAQKHTEKHRRVPRQVALRTVKLCKVTPKTLTNSDVYGFTSSGILRREVVGSIARRGVSVSLGAARRIRVVQACSIDHSDISPFRIDDLQTARL